MRVWRLVKTKRAASAFDGEGARVAGGRWNSVGTRAVYTSESPSLAILEILVHLESEAALQPYSLISAEVPTRLIAKFSTLPPDWNAEPAPASTKRIGDWWARNSISVALVVPSVISPTESNLLLNPLHPDFAQVQIEPPSGFSLDPRLVGKRRP